MADITEDRIEGYLARLAHRLTVDPATRAAILEEVRGHLEEGMETGMEAGMGEQAETNAARAIANFGAVERVARRFNAVHPVDWTSRRAIVGMLQGIAAAWLVWTLVTYPLLVQHTLEQDHLGAGTLANPLNPAGLLFAATPLSFGLFHVLSASPLDMALELLAFLVLFAAIPFVWGARARRWWQPGLAFGLGVIIGFPWLLPAVVMNWNDVTAWSLMLAVLAIWLLFPYAIGASWLGHRLLGARPDARPSTADTATGQEAKARNGHVYQARFAAPLLLPHARQPWAARIVSAGILLVLLGLNGWSLLRTTALAPRVASASEQLTLAQRSVSFAIRQPASLPSGLVLVSVASSKPACAQCYVDLTYQGPNGAQILLSEWSGETSTTPLPAPPQYQVSEGTVGSVRPVWWLEQATTVEHQINLTWAAGGLVYVLSSTGTLSVDDLEQIAGSI